MPNQESEILLEFRIGKCNGTMHMQIFNQDQLVATHNKFDSDYFTVTQSISWPSTIKIVVSNKDLSCDTKVDYNGNIIADKYIELKKITVDRLESDLSFLQSIVLDTGETKVNSTYWGFNGTVNLEFNQFDSLTWHLRQKIKQDKTYITNQKKF